MDWPATKQLLEKKYDGLSEEIQKYFDALSDDKREVEHLPSCAARFLTQCCYVLNNDKGPLDPRLESAILSCFHGYSRFCQTTVHDDVKLASSLKPMLYIISNLGGKTNVTTLISLSESVLSILKSITDLDNKDKVSDYIPKFFSFLWNAAITYENQPDPNLLQVCQLRLTSLRLAALQASKRRTCVEKMVLALSIFEYKSSRRTGGKGKDEKKPAQESVKSGKNKKGVASVLKTNDKNGGCSKSDKNDDDDDDESCEEGSRDCVFQLIVAALEDTVPQSNISPSSLINLILNIYSILASSGLVHLLDALKSKVTMLAPQISDTSCVIAGVIEPVWDIMGVVQQLCQDSSQSLRQQDLKVMLDNVFSWCFQQNLTFETDIKSYVEIFLWFGESIKSKKVRPDFFAMSDNVIRVMHVFEEVSKFLVKNSPTMCGVKNGELSDQEWREKVSKAHLAAHRCWLMLFHGTVAEQPSSGNLQGELEDVWSQGEEQTTAYLSAIDMATHCPVMEQSERYSLGSLCVKLGHVYHNKAQDEAAVWFYNIACQQLTAWCRADPNSFHTRCKEASLIKLYNCLSQSQLKVGRLDNAMATISQAVGLGDEVSGGDFPLLMKSWLKLKKMALKEGGETMQERLARCVVEEGGSSVETVCHYLELELNYWFTGCRLWAVEGALLKRLNDLSALGVKKDVYHLMLLQFDLFTNHPMTTDREEVEQCCGHVMDTYPHAAPLHTHAFLLHFCLRVKYKLDKPVAESTEEGETHKAGLPVVGRHDKMLGQEETGLVTSALHAWTSQSPGQDTHDLLSDAHALPCALMDMLVMVADVLWACRQCVLLLEVVSLMKQIIKDRTWASNYQHDVHFYLLEALTAVGVAKLPSTLVDAFTQGLSDKGAGPPDKGTGLPDMGVGLADKGAESVRLSLVNFYLQSGQADKAYPLLNALRDREMSGEMGTLHRGKLNRLMYLCVLATPHCSLHHQYLLPLIQKAYRAHYSVFTRDGAEDGAALRSSNQTGSESVWRKLVEMLETTLTLCRAYRHAGDAKRARCYLKEGLKLSRKFGLLKWSAIYGVELTELMCDCQSLQPLVSTLAFTYTHLTTLEPHTTADPAPASKTKPKCRQKPGSVSVDPEQLVKQCETAYNDLSPVLCGRRDEPGETVVRFWQKVQSCVKMEEEKRDQFLKDVQDLSVLVLSWVTSTTSHPPACCCSVCTDLESQRLALTLTKTAVKVVHTFSSAEPHLRRLFQSVLTKPRKADPSKKVEETLRAMSVIGDSDRVVCRDVPLRICLTELCALLVESALERCNVQQAMMHVKVGIDAVNQLPTNHPDFWQVRARMTYLQAVCVHLSGVGSLPPMSGADWRDSWFWLSDAQLEVHVNTKLNNIKIKTSASSQSDSESVHKTSASNHSNSDSVHKTSASNQFDYESVHKTSASNHSDCVTVHKTSVFSSSCPTIVESNAGLPSMSVTGKNEEVSASKVWGCSFDAKLSSVTTDGATDTKLSSAAKLANKETGTKHSSTIKVGESKHATKQSLSDIKLSGCKTERHDACASIIEEYSLTSNTVRSRHFTPASIVEQSPLISNSVSSKHFTPASTVEQFSLTSNAMRSRQFTPASTVQENLTSNAVTPVKTDFHSVENLAGIETKKLSRRKGRGYDIDPSQGVASTSNTSKTDKKTKPTKTSLQTSATSVNAKPSKGGRGRKTYRDSYEDRSCESDPFIFCEKSIATRLFGEEFSRVEQHGATGSGSEDSSRNTSTEEKSRNKLREAKNGSEETSRTSRVARNGGEKPSGAARSGIETTSDSAMKESEKPSGADKPSCEESSRTPSTASMAKNRTEEASKTKSTSRSHTEHSQQSKPDKSKPPCHTPSPCPSQTLHTPTRPMSGTPASLSSLLSQTDSGDEFQPSTPKSMPRNTGSRPACRSARSHSGRSITDRSKSGGEEIKPSQGKDSCKSRQDSDVDTKSSSCTQNEGKMTSRRREAVKSTKSQAKINSSTQSQDCHDDIHQPQTDQDQIKSKLSKTTQNKTSRSKCGSKTFSNEAESSETNSRRPTRTSKSRVKESCNTSMEGLEQQLVTLTISDNPMPPPSSKTRRSTRSTRAGTRNPRLAKDTVSVKAIQDDLAGLDLDKERVRAGDEPLEIDIHRDAFDLVDIEGEWDKKTTRASDESLEIDIHRDIDLFGDGEWEMETVRAGGEVLQVDSHRDTFDFVGSDEYSDSSLTAGKKGKRGRQTKTTTVKNSKNKNKMTTKISYKPAKTAGASKPAKSTSTSKTKTGQSQSAPVKPSQKSSVQVETLSVKSSASSEPDINCKQSSVTELTVPPSCTLLAPHTDLHSIETLRMGDVTTVLTVKQAKDVATPHVTPAYTHVKTGEKRHVTEEDKVWRADHVLEYFHNDEEEEDDKERGDAVESLADVDFASPNQKEEAVHTLQSHLMQSVSLTQHFPHVTLSSDSSKLAAHLQLAGDGDQWQIAALLGECAAVSLRHQILAYYSKIIRRMCRLRETEETEGGEGVGEMKDHLQDLMFPWSLDRFAHVVQSLPQGWTVCQFNVVDTPGHPTLLLTRLTSDLDPITVPLPHFSDSKGQSIYFSFKDIMKANDQVQKIEENKQWWRHRALLEVKLANTIEGMEKYWLGPWKGMLVAQTSDVHYNTTMSDLSTTLVALLTSSLRCSCSHSKARQILELLQHTKDLATVLSQVLGRDDIADNTDLLTSVTSQVVQRLPKVTHSDLPVVLILDKQLANFPIEQLSIMKNQSVTRVPSLSLLHHLLKRHGNPGTMTSLQVKGQRSGSVKVVGERGVMETGLEPESVYYMINPDGDLTKTQKLLEPVFTGYKKWEGVSGEVPTKDQYRHALSNYHLFVYSGHGSGSKYYPMEELLKTSCSAVPMLFGCGSVKLDIVPSLDPDAYFYSYLLAGSPCVLGNLWDVTDRDIDTFALKIFSLWFDSKGSQSSLNLPSLVRQARGACRMHLLNGGAPVLYGLPVPLNPVMK